MTPDQIDSAVVGVASLVVAGLSFIYASKAQKATKDAEVARTRGSEIAVDAAAYQRARELYESAIDSLTDQNTGLQTQVKTLRESSDSIDRRYRRLENRVSQLERFLIESGLQLPTHLQGGGNGGTN